MNEDLARNRVIVMGMMRLSGVAMIMVAILITQGIIDWPREVAYVLAAVGVVDVFVVPQIFARRWRSPRE